MTGKLTITSATIAMVTSMLGSGVLFLPQSFRIFGYFYGPLVLIISSIACVCTIYMISYSSYAYRKKLLNKNSKKKSEKIQTKEIKQYSNSESKTNSQNVRYKQCNEYRNKNESAVDIQSQNIDVQNIQTEEQIDASLSYYSVAKHHSPILGSCVDICIILQGLGSCVCYILTMGDWILSLSGVSIHRFLLSAMVMVPVYFLAIQKSLSSLKYASILSVSAVIYLAVLLIFYSFSMHSLRASSAPAAVAKEIPKGISTILFALGSHQNIVQVFSELADKKMKVIGTVSLLTYALGPLLYMVIAFCGFYITQDEARSNIYSILLSKTGFIGSQIEKETFDSKKLLPSFGASIFLFVLICAFPMQMHPTRNSILNLLSTTKYFNKLAKKNINRFRFIITTICCTAIYFISIIEDLKPDAVVDFIGATATVGITFIFPPIIYAMTIAKMNYQAILSCFVGFLGICLSIFLVYNQISSNK